MWITKNGLIRNIHPRQAMGFLDSGWVPLTAGHCYVGDTIGVGGKGLLIVSKCEDRVFVGYDGGWIRPEVILKHYVKGNLMIQPAFKTGQKVCVMHNDGLFEITRFLRERDGSISYEVSDVDGVHYGDYPESDISTWKDQFVKGSKVTLANVVPKPLVKGVIYEVQGVEGQDLLVCSAWHSSVLFDRVEIKINANRQEIPF